MIKVESAMVIHHSESTCQTNKQIINKSKITYVCETCISTIFPIWFKYIVVKTIEKKSKICITMSHQLGFCKFKLLLWIKEWSLSKWFPHLYQILQLFIILPLYLYNDRIKISEIGPNFELLHPMYWHELNKNLEWSKILENYFHGKFHIKKSILQNIS